MSCGLVQTGAYDQDSRLARSCPALPPRVATGAPRCACAGTKATELMWELKELFDPDYILNPGVILNKDPLVHVKNLKPSPAANPLVNRCIECGFCESNCPSRCVEAELVRRWPACWACLPRLCFDSSPPPAPTAHRRDITLTPRQRIAVYKELYRLRSMDNRTAAQQTRLDEMAKIFEYDGQDTCAADGMCQEKCPVKINTGELIKQLRSDEMAEAPRASALAMVRGGAWHGESVEVCCLLLRLAHQLLLVPPPPCPWLVASRGWPTTFPPPRGPSTSFWAW